MAGHPAQHRLTIHRFTLSPWQQWEGELHASLTPARQDITYNGEQVSIKGQLRGQTLSISQFDVQLPDQPQPVKLIGEFTLPLVPDGVPVKGHTVATFNVPQLSSLVDADLDWEDNQGQLVVMARDNPDPLLDLPWQITAQQLTISDGRWNWSASGMPMSGRVGLKVDNWQQGLEKATFTGRLNVLTRGMRGRATRC